MTYTCPKCGKEHEEWPIIHFNVPDFYKQLSATAQKEAYLTPDLCIIPTAEQTDHFIYCIMHQKVNEHCTDLVYGLWISLSEKNYRDYVDNLQNEAHTTHYFGWLSNWLPEYEKFEWVKMYVAVNVSIHQPPRAFVQVVNDPDIPLVRDFFQGISLIAAQSRVDKSKKS